MSAIRRKFMIGAIVVLAGAGESPAGELVAAYKVLNECLERYDRLSLGWGESKIKGERSLQVNNKRFVWLLKPRY